MGLYGHFPYLRLFFGRVVGQMTIKWHIRRSSRFFESLTRVKSYWCNSSCRDVTVGDSARRDATFFCRWKSDSISNRGKHWHDIGAYQTGINPDVKATPVVLAGLTLTVLLPSFAASAWMIRKLRKTYSAREARAVSIAFGLCAPIFLCVSMLFGEITGGYAEALGGDGFFILMAHLAVHSYSRHF